VNPTPQPAEGKPSRTPVNRALARLADSTDLRSVASRLRKRRFAFFQSLLDTLPAPVRILDVGGTQHYWRIIGPPDGERVQVVLLNLVKPQVSLPGFTSVIGDARAMTGVGDGEFDVVFSNSVIEHLGTAADQKRMADEVRRVGRRYFVQTPNKHFPMEPHFLVPCFQYLPAPARAWLLSRRPLGWQKKASTYDEALQRVRTFRLLSRRELQRLFPEARLYRERFLGMEKSFVAYHGW